MAQEILDGFTASQQESLNELRTQCRTKMLLLSAVMLSITVLGAGALSMSPTFTYAEAAVVIGFVTMLTLAALLNRLENQFKAQARQTPELLPPDVDSETLAAWLETEQQYQKLRRSMKAERTLILLAGFVLSAVFPPAFLISIVIAAIRWHMRSAAFEEEHQSPFHAADMAIEQPSRRIQWASFGLWIVLLGVMLWLQMMSYAAHNKVTSFNSWAKQIYNAAMTYQVELDSEDQDPRFETTIIPPGEIGAEGTLSYGVNKYCSDADQLWYAVVCDAEGNVTAAYISRSELKPSDLHPQDFESQLEQMESPFHQKEVIGFYVYTPPQETTGVNTYG